MGITDAAGYITYANAAKQDMLGVQDDCLAQHGAVSEACVREMAMGALSRSQSDVALAVSGVAGPTGGSAEKPVGTVCFAWATMMGQVRTLSTRFDGDRASVRDQAAIIVDRLRRHRTSTFRALIADCDTTLLVVGRFLRDLIQK